MKKIYLLLLLTSVFVQIKAQDYDIILGGTVSDVETYMQYYLAPLERGLGHAAGSGVIKFSNTKHKVAFTFGIDLSASITPKSQRSFDINAIGFNELKASEPDNSFAQSISGSQESIGLETKQTYLKPTATYPFYKEVPLSEFDSPEGSGYAFSPLPTISAGFYGAGTHLSFRFLPTIKPSEDMSVFSYGVNLQHNLDRFISPMKEWPVQISIAGGYHYSQLIEYLDVQPDKTKFGLELNSDNGPYDDQKATLDVVSIPFQVVVYHDFNGLTVYGGPGYTYTQSDFTLSGNFPVYAKDPFDNFKVTVKDIRDPFDYSRTYSSFRFDVGINYQIGFAKFKASYTIAKYQTIYIGLGFII